jgi:hypothetical protein
MARRLIGSGTTDSNGRISVPYTGTGAGKIQLVAVNGTLQSETYEVYDCKWYDFGTDSTNNIWLNSSTMTVNYGDDCATLTETTSGTTGILVTDTNHYIQPNDVFEFDFMQVDGSRNYAPIYIRNKTNGASLTSFHLTHINQQINTWIHLKCQIIDTTLYIYVNDNPTPVERPMSNTDTDYRIYLNTPTDTTTLKYKNFKVYPG